MVQDVTPITVCFELGLTTPSFENVLSNSSRWTSYNFVAGTNFRHEAHPVPTPEVFLSLLSAPYQCLLSKIEKFNTLLDHNDWAPITL